MVRSLNFKPQRCAQPLQSNTKQFLEGLHGLGRGIVVELFGKNLLFRGKL